MIEWTHIPGGRFLMGSDSGKEDEAPVHEVELDAFDCAIYPVTQAQWAAYGRAALKPGAERVLGEGGLAEDLPVTSVSWIDAQEFCAWRTSVGDPVRLPTEAEWEFAARGGLAGAAYSWGDGIPAWIPQRGRGPLSGPWPVTLGEPNGYGLFGIGANIHEWCSDWYSSTYYAQSPSRNPQGPDAGRRKASRGGAWRHDITISRCAQRSRIDPAFRYTDYGFRVVRNA